MNPQQHQNLQNILNLIKAKQMDLKIRGDISTEQHAEICSNFKVTPGELLYQLICLFMHQYREINALKEKNLRLEQRNEILEDYLKKHKEDGRTKQQNLVKSGLAIAQKPSKSLIELKLLMKLGNTDQDLMEHFNISRSTLWRWKKELQNPNTPY